MSQSDNRIIDTDSLYPAPKTFNELEQENNRRQMRLAARQPKMITIRIAFELSALFLAICSISVLVPALIFDAPLAGVSISLLMGLLTAWIGYREYDRVSVVFGSKQMSAQLFFVFYAICFVTLYGAFLANSTFVNALTIAAVHLGAVWLMVSIYISKQLTSIKKLFALSIALLALAICVSVS